MQKIVFTIIAVISIRLNYAQSPKEQLRLINSVTSLGYNRIQLKTKEDY